MNQQRFECEVTAQLEQWEDIYKRGEEYLLREDPDFIDWLTERQNEDKAYQMKDAK